MLEASSVWVPWAVLLCPPLLREAKLSLDLMGHILVWPECFKEYL